MGYLYLELGDAAEALLWDRRAVEASLNSPESSSKFETQRYSLLNLATDYLHLDKIDEALETIVQFEAITEVPFAVRFRYYNRYLLLMAGLPPILEFLGTFFPGYIVDLFESLSIMNHFEALGRGVVRLSDLWFYSVMVAGWMVASMVILGEKKAA